MIRRATSPAEYLVRRRFPEYGQVRQPPSLGNPWSGLLGQDPARLHAAEAYKAELLALPPAEIERLAAEERAREAEERRKRAEIDDQRLGFGAAWALADFDHWSRMTYWSLDEALLLAFAMEPGQVSLHNILSKAETSPSASKLVRSRDLIQRAKNWQQLTDPTSPGVFLAWAKRTGIAIPPALEAAVTTHGVVIGDWQSLYEQANERTESWKAFAEKLPGEANQRIADLTAERDRLAQELEASRAAQTATEDTTKSEISAIGRKTLLLTLYAMARKHYRYDPQVRRSDAARNISDTLALYGIEITDETIRNWLKEGATLAPPLSEGGH